jgi:preprotein translocase subunit Sec61beta
MAGGVRRRLPLGNKPTQSGSGVAPVAAATATVAAAAASSSSSSSSSASSSSSSVRANVAQMFSTAGVKVGESDPGLKVEPTLVLMLSLCFIAFVIVLHIGGRVFRG